MRTKVFILGVASAVVLGVRAADEFAISFRVRVEEPVAFPGEKSWYGAGMPVAHGLAIRKYGLFGSSPFTFTAKSEAGFMGARTYHSVLEAETNPGAWHHVAFAFSRAKREARLWFDGVGQQAWKLADGETFDDAALMALKPSAKTPCEIAGLKTFKTRLADEAALFKGDVPADQSAAARAAFEKAAAEPGVNASFAAWCRAKAQEAASFGADADMRAWHRLETLRLRLPRLLPLAKAAPDSPALAFAIDAYGPNKHLPYAVPGDAKPFAGVKIAGALGEWDCASFMVHPLADAKEFFLAPSDLKGPEGAVIPAAAVDVRVVKCWYQCGAAFNTYFPAGRGTPLLCPEMLLHDDAFMRVDTAARRNYLRVSYPDGDAYADVSDPCTEATLKPFNYHLEPVRDAKTFRPLDLREGEMRQFWITMKLPADAKPGDYAGEIALSAGGKPCGTLPLSVKVHPFRLPWPAPHYDLDRAMIHSYLSHCSVAEKLAGGGNSGAAGCPRWDLAIRRRDAEIRNMVEHGFANVDVASYSGPSNAWDVSDADAVLLKRNGARLKPIFGDLGVEWEFALWAQYSPPDGVTNISVEANYDFWSSTMVAYSNRMAAARERLLRAYGHSDTVCYGFDEAGPEVVRREMPFFATLNHFGSTSYASQGRPDHAAFILDFDGCPQDIHRDTAHSWHASGTLLTTYAVPHGGPENPDLWRRRKGLFLWFADFDGQREYIWFEGADVWNEFVQGTQYKNFNMVQPTIDGVIDSIQWEANREGIDDMRYATLLKRACRAARATGDPALVKAGRLHDVWLELSDYKTGDLDALRLEMAACIAELQKALAAKGVSLASLSPPEPVPQDLPLPKPYAQTGDEYARRNMLDYACRAWEAEGTDEARFKAVEAHLALRETDAAEKLLAAFEASGSTSVPAKAKGRLMRGFIGLAPTRFDWKPTDAALAAARKALDVAVKHDYARIPADELARHANKLMRAFGDAGKFDEAIKVGETLADGPLKKALGRGSGKVSGVDVNAYLGECHFTLKQYRRAMGRFAKCGRDYNALIRLGDSARAQKDYSAAMAAYADAALMLKNSEDKHKYERTTRLVAEMSAAVRKNVKINADESQMTNSASDDALDDLKLDEDD